MTPVLNFRSNTQATDRQLRRIRINQIKRNPHQPRKYFDPEAIDQLADSIRLYGVLNPLSVRKVGDSYELIAGERRLRASRIAGLTEIPCIVMSASEEDSSALALVENLQRRDLDFFEEAEGFKKLIDTFGLTQEEAAHKVGKTQSAVANKLRLLRLSPKNVEMIRESGLTERHARAILRLADETARLDATRHVIEHQMNVSRTEQYIDHLLSAPKEEQRRPMVRLLKDVRFFLNTVDKAVNVMKDSGVNAKMEREEKGDDIVLRILIPNCKRSC